MFGNSKRLDVIDDRLDILTVQIARLTSTVEGNAKTHTFALFMSVAVSALFGIGIIGAAVSLDKKLTAPCCKAELPPQPLIDMIANSEEDKLMSDDKFVNKLIAAVWENGPLGKPWVGKLNIDAVKDGKPFKVYSGAGMVLYTEYRIEPQPNTTIVRYVGKDFELFIDHDCISGYFEVGQNDYIVRVDTVDTNYVVTYPAKRPNLTRPNPKQMD